MPRFVAPPFKRASGENVRTTGWSIGEGTPLPEEISGWDPTVDIDVTVQLEVNGAAILEECQLSGNDAAPQMSGTWWSRGTGLRGNGSIEVIKRSFSSEPCSVTIPVSGGDLLGAVEFSVSLVLPAMASTRTPLSAWRPGSVLWSDTRTVQLGGQGGRFPVEWTDFSEGREFHSESGWQLDWDANNLETPALAGLRLYLNSGSPRMVSAVEREGDAADSDLVRYMRYDVARMLITGVLGNPDFGSEEYPDESVGLTLRRLIRALFPDEEVPQIRQRMIDRPFRFDSDLQGRLRLLRESTQ